MIPSPISSLLQHHRPSSEVCFGADGVRTTGQLTAYAAALAEVLSDRSKGERIILACRDRYHFSAALLAALHRGLVCVLPESTQPEAVEALSCRLAVPGVLHDSPDVRLGLDVRRYEHPETVHPRTLSCALSLSDIAFVALTSGSTGAPTAHEKTLGQLVLEAQTHARTFELRGHRVVSAVPPHHIYGLLFGVLAPLLCGGSLLRETPLFPSTLVAALAAHQARVLVAVPAHFSALSRELELVLPRLERTFSSAGPLPPQVAESLGERGMVITEIFGSTELGGVACREHPAAPWRPMEGVEVRAADDGECLQVRSAWSDGGQFEWTSTSDRVELVEGGFFHRGRADSVVKIGGRRVDLRDLELQLERAPGVDEARVLAVHHAGATRDTSLWAVVAGRGLSVDALRKALAERFNQVTWPRRFRFVERLPRAETGKVTRAALLALFDDGPGSRPALDPPNEQDGAHS